VSCNLRQNCKARDECVWCNNYEYYVAINKKIKSPPQIEKILAKKAEKKAKKQSDSSKRGRANRLAGKRAEKDRRSEWENHGYVVSQVPMSGALKSSVVVKDQVIHMSSDNWVTIRGKIYYEEVKRSGSINKLYTLTCYGCVHIEGLGYLFRDDIWWQFLDRFKPDEMYVVENKGFKQLEKWFAQDKADIVSARTTHLPWVTCITEEMYKELS